MPTLTTQDYAAICKKSYNEDNDMHQGVPVKIPKGSNQFYKIHLEKSDARTDFQGYLLEKLDSNQQGTGEFITVFRGSHSRKDWQGNMEVLHSGKHHQTQIAMSFAKEAYDKAIELSNGKPFSMVNTGHSLGGAQAQLAHLVNHAPVVTFNPLPATLFKDENGKFFVFKPNSPIENHVMALDIASPLGKLPGNTKMYARPENIATLVVSGYGSLLRNHPLEVVAVDAKMGLSHSIDHFNGENSVLSKPDSKNIAQKFSSIIGEWRNDAFGLDKSLQISQLFGLTSGAMSIPDKYQEIKDEILEKKNQINQIVNNIQRGAGKINDIIDFINKFDFRKNFPKINLGEINLNQDFNAVQVASADKNFIPSLEPILSPTSQRVIQQCDEKFTALCERRGVTADHPDEMDNVKIAAAYAALNAGLTKIDKMDFGENRTLFMLSHEPHMKLASLSTDEAVNIPVSQSMANIHIMEQQNVQQSQERQMTQSQQQNQGRTIG